MTTTEKVIENMINHRLPPSSNQIIAVVNEIKNGSVTDAQLHALISSLTMIAVRSNYGDFNICQTQQDQL